MPPTPTNPEAQVSPDPASSPSEQPPILERGSVRVGNSSCILRHLMR